MKSLEQIRKELAWFFGKPLTCTLTTDIIQFHSTPRAELFIYKDFRVIFFNDLKSDYDMDLYIKQIASILGYDIKTLYGFGSDFYLIMTDEEKLEFTMTYFS